MTLNKQDDVPIADSSENNSPLSEEELSAAYKETDRLAEKQEASENREMLGNSGILRSEASSAPFIQVAQRSDVGLVRERNEDACFSFVGQSGGSTPLIPFSLGMVADGMGGHSNGHEASRKVADQIARYVLDRVYIPLLKGLPAQKPLQEIMGEAVEIANQSIHNPDPEQEGGTTLTGALIVGRRLYLIHIGDTRAYLITDDLFEQLTTDHSIVKRLEEAGQITAEQAAHHPHRNLLYRALTGNEMEVDTHTRSLPKNGYLFICSDGLWDYLPESDIEQIVRDRELSLQERCEKLVEGALKNESSDNVTGVLIHFRVG